METMEDIIKRIEDLKGKDKTRYKISKKLMNEIRKELSDLFDIDSLKEFGFDIDTDSDIPPDQWSEKDNELISKLWELQMKIVVMLEQKLEK